MKLRMRPRTVISTTYRGQKDVITNLIYNAIGICTQIVPVQASNEDTEVYLYLGIQLYCCVAGADLADVSR